MTQVIKTTAGERTQGLIQGIEDLFKMMDEGILVRDISRDGDADFYKRNLDFVMRMATVKQALDAAKLQGNRGSAAQWLIDTINATGGIGRDLKPAADPTWIDLGLAYIQACEELGVEPKYDDVIGVYDPVGGAMNECSKCHDMVKKIIVCRDAQLCESCFGKTEVATII